MSFRVEVGDGSCDWFGWGIEDGIAGIILGLVVCVKGLSVEGISVDESGVFAELVGEVMVLCVS